MRKQYLIPDYKENLTWAANLSIFVKAKKLRKSMTLAEKELWKHLRGNQLDGLKFRRQHPLEFYIADFYCHQKRLIIEVDGEIHDSIKNKEYDDERTLELEAKGFKILRFRNEEVIRSIDEVLFKIKNSL